MSVYGEYGTTVTNCNKAIEKAKQKNDGVYKLKGLYYRVKDHKVTHFAAYNNVYQFCYGFLVKIATLESKYGEDNCRKSLLAIKD